MHCRDISPGVLRSIRRQGRVSAEEELSLAVASWPGGTTEIDMFGTGTDQGASGPHYELVTSGDDGVEQSNQTVGSFLASFQHLFVAQTLAGESGSAVSDQGHGHHAQAVLSRRDDFRDRGHAHRVRAQVLEG